MDRRRQPVADRGRPDRDPGLGAPRVRGQVIGQLRDQEHGRVGPDRRPGRTAARPRGVARGHADGALDHVGRGRSHTAPPQFGRLRQPVERLGRPGQLDGVRAGGQEVQQGVEQRRLPCPLGRRGDHERDSRLDQEPERGGELGIERAGADQLDDRSRFGRDRAEGPPAPRRRGVGHERLRTRGGDAGSGGQRTAGSEGRQTHLAVARGSRNVESDRSSIEPWLLRVTRVRAVRHPAATNCRREARSSARRSDNGVVVSQLPLDEWQVARRA